MPVIYSASTYVFVVITTFVLYDHFVIQFLCIPLSGEMASPPFMHFHDFILPLGWNLVEKRRLSENVNNVDRYWVKDFGDRTVRLMTTKEAKVFLNAVADGNDEETSISKIKAFELLFLPKQDRLVILKEKRLASCACSEIAVSKTVCKGKRSFKVVTSPSVASPGLKNQNKASSVSASSVACLCLPGKDEKYFNSGDKKRCHSNVSCDAFDSDTDTKLPPRRCKVQSKSDRVLESINKLSKEFVALQKEVNSTRKT